MVEVLGLVGITEIQVVGDADRHSTGAGKIASALCNSNTCSDTRIEFAIDGIAVGSGRQDLVRLADNEDRCIGTGKYRRPCANHVVVLAPDPALAGDAGMSEKLRQSSLGISLGQRGQIKLGRWRERSGLAGIERAVIGQRPGRDIHHDIVPVADAHHAVVGDLADLGIGQIPLLENLFHDGLLALFDDDEHALLRFA